MSATRGSAQEMARRAAAALERLRAARPLVHHITNLVVMNDTANLTLLLGASPVMAHAPEEVEEMVALAGALVLNPGTLERDWIEAMLRAGLRARELSIPVILDPVGAGATSFRTTTNRMLLERVRPTIVRGNAGEIGALFRLSRRESAGAGYLPIRAHIRVGPTTLPSSRVMHYHVPARSAWTSWP